MCTSELCAGGDKIPPRYAVLDRSCTRLGFRYREPEPKKRIWDQTPSLVQREGAALPYCLMSRMHSESPTPRNVLQQFEGTKNISGSLIMSSWAETPLKGGVVINASSTLAVPAVSFSRSGLQLARSSCSSWCTSLPTEAQNDSRCNLTLPRFPTPPPWLP